MSALGVDVNHAAKLLQNDEIIGIPTETVYGLAGNALKPSVVAKIFEAKDRPKFDPLIVHIGRLSQVQDLVEPISQELKSLLKDQWPGPLTVLLPRKGIIPDLTVAGSNKVAIRMPNQKLTLELLGILDFPLAAPSANPFGYISPTTAEHVLDQLGDKVTYVLDGGPCQIGIESTIIEPIGKECTILRLGGLDLEVLKPYFDKIHLKLSQNSNPQAPGQLDKHYSPGKKLSLFTNKSEMPLNEKAIYILFDSPLKNIPLNQQLILSEGSDLGEAAANVFAYLRKADKMDGIEIFVQSVPECGLGLAINDRLRRAAAQ